MSCFGGRGGEPRGTGRTRRKEGEWGGGEGSGSEQLKTSERLKLSVILQFPLSIGRLFKKGREGRLKRQAPRSPTRGYHGMGENTLTRIICYEDLGHFQGIVGKRGNAAFWTAETLHFKNALAAG